MAQKEIKEFRDFPSVEQLLENETLRADLSLLPRPAASEIVKSVVAAKKVEFKAGKKTTLSQLYKAISNAILSFKRTEVTRVINATGIVVHTNLGRAPLPEELFDSVKKSVVGYSNLEFDLASGKRGSRGDAAEKYLSILAGAESSTIVNNCAAALFLILNTLANGKKVIISRGELVQIGGGFRIHDILKRSGAKIVEIGSTNITTLDDYREAIDDKTALILKVHKSNFVQSGFTDEVSSQDLLPITREFNLTLVNDLGSGVLIPTKPLLGYDEETVQQSVRSGNELTSFSGDKMLGGVQSGLIVGKAELIKKIKKNPLFRTMRVDKIVFSILEKLFAIYLRGEAESEIKLWQLLSLSESELYRTGKSILAELGSPTGLSVEATRAFVGGGALPGSDIPSVAVIFDSSYKATKLLRFFREQKIPIIGRIENERFLIDLKAIDRADLPYLVNSIRKSLG